MPIRLQRDALQFAITASESTLLFPGKMVARKKMKAPNRSARAIWNCGGRRGHASNHLCGARGLQAAINNSFARYLATIASDNFLHARSRSRRLFHLKSERRDGNHAGALNAAICILMRRGDARRDESGSPSGTLRSAPVKSRALN